MNGILVLPVACDELSVGVQDISATEYVLTFTTWQDPSVACPVTPTPRAFETVAFAPQNGVAFIATLDGKSLPILIVPQAATSTIP